MSVSVILGILAIAMILSPIIGITFAYCTEYYFKRKEKHILWLAELGIQEDTE